MALIAKTHTWPKDGEHFWGPWMAKTAQKGKQPATQYRMCIHPNCNQSQERETPKA